MLDALRADEMRHRCHLLVTYLSEAVIDVSAGIDSDVMVVAANEHR